MTSEPQHLRVQAVCVPITSMILLILLTCQLLLCIVHKISRGYRKNIYSCIKFTRNANHSASEHSWLAIPLHSDDVTCVTHMSCHISCHMSPPKVTP